MKSLVVSVALLASAAASHAEPLGPGVGSVTGPVAGPEPATVTSDRAAADAASSEKGIESRPLGSTKERLPPKPREGAGRATIPSANASKAESPWGGIVGPLVAVLALIGILAGVVALVVRGRGGLAASLAGGRRAPAGILEVLGKYPLSRTQTLILLKVDRRVLLLSQAKSGRLGATQAATLCEITEPEEVASILTKVSEAEQNSLTNRFSAVLRSLDREAVEKLDVVPAAPALSRRAAPVLLPRTAVRGAAGGSDMTGAQAAASIRSRLQAIRVGGGA